MSKAGQPAGLPPRFLVNAPTSTMYSSARTFPQNYYIRFRPSWVMTFSLNCQTSCTLSMANPLPTTFPPFQTSSIAVPDSFYRRSEQFLSLIPIGLNRGQKVFAQGIGAASAGNRSRSHDRLRLRKSSCAPTQTIKRLYANSNIHNFQTKWQNTNRADIQRVCPILSYRSILMIT